MRMCPQKNAHRGVWMAAMVFCLLATGFAYVLVRSQEAQAVRREFHQQAGDCIQALTHLMEINRGWLQSLNAFFLTRETVGPEDFEGYLRHAVGRPASVQAFEWAPRVTEEQRDAFVQSARASGWKDYEISQRNAQGELETAGKREEYFPVHYMVPREANLPAVGYDVASDPSRLETLSKARDTGELVASRTLDLVQGETGFIVAAPVYDVYPAPDTAAERRAALTGFCIGVYRIDHIIDQSLALARQSGLNISILSDGAEPATGGTTSPAQVLLHQSTIDFCGRTWTVRCRPGPGFQAGFHRWKSASALLAGLGLVGMVGLACRLSGRQARELENDVHRRSRELSQAYRELEEEMRERSRVESALQQSQRQLTAILDHTSAVIYVKNLQGEYVLVNRRFERLFNVSLGKIKGKTDHDLFSEEVANQFRANDLKVLASGRPQELEEWMIQDGKRLTYLSVKYPLKDNEGKATAICGISTDITGRKAMEEALKVSEERYGLIINGINDGIWDWNLLTNEVYYSPRWKSMLGYEEAEVPNHVSAWKNLLHPDDYDRVLAILSEYLDGTRSCYELEHRLRHKNGAYRWILTRGIALCNQEGRPVRMVGSHVDITERKQTDQKLRSVNIELASRESQLRKALADLKTTHSELQSTQLQLIQAEKLESIGKLAAGIAHEVKNPLQTMLMGLTLLERRLKNGDAATRMACSEMRQAIQRADTIVRGLLQMSGTPELDKARLNINDIVTESINLLTYNMNASRVVCESHLSPTLPLLSLDRGKMEQVFVNLLTNAIHAMPDGGTIIVSTYALTPRVPLEGEASCKAIVVAEVRDTGSGISRENLDKLFTPFFTTKAKGMGTGLGLSVCRSIVELHGGTLELDNLPGGGAQARLTFTTQMEVSHEKSAHPVC